MPQTKVMDIYKQDYASVKETDNLSKGINLFEEKRVPTLVVRNANGKIVGMLSRRWIRRSALDPSTTKVKTLTRSPPSIGIHDDITEAARLMIENQVMRLPAYDGEKLKGFVTDEDIFNHLTQEDWGKTPIEQVMTRNPETVNHEDSLAKVMTLFRENGFSHAPILKEGVLQGVVSIQDIIDVAYGPRKRQSRGERAGEKVDLSGMAVSNAWSTPVIEAKRNERLSDAWNRMKQNEVSCLIIAENRVPIGIITKKDLLEPIAQRSMESRQMTLQFSVKPDIKISEGARQSMLKDFDSFIRKYKKQLGLGKLFVYMKGHGSMKKGDQLIHCRLQFHTSVAQFYSKAEAWSAQEAFSLALDRLERRVIQSKEMKLDQKQRWKHFDRFMESEL